jgi:site-specific DNA-methyltransferase (adenine-specific)
MALATNQFHCSNSDDDLLPRLVQEGAKFDLVLTDPPYNLNKDFGNDSDRLELAEFLSVNRRRIELCSELLSETGSLIWFAIHHFVGHLQVIMYETGLYYRRMNIWRYENGFSRSPRAPRGEYEPFLWFSKGLSHWTFNADDVRVPYKSEKRLRNPVYYKNNRGERVAWTPNPKGAMRGDIWEFPTLAGHRFADERTGHPTQKPEPLIRELVKAFCPKNEGGQLAGRILDPYAGSGTLGVVCEKLNREGHDIRWVCSELEQEWVDVSNQRVESVRSTLL